MGPAPPIHPQVIPPPPPTVFYLSNTDKIRLLAVLQTERQYFTTLALDPTASEAVRDFYGAKVKLLNDSISSLLTFLNQ